MKKNSNQNNMPLTNIKVGLYNPYLDVLGGGEKHILSIIDVFAQKGAEITVFWDQDLTKELKKRFSLQSINRLKWLPSLKTLSVLQKLKILSQFDYFFYVTDGSYFFSTARKNFVFCMVPDKKLYNLKVFNRIKLWNYKFISNSPYTTKWLKKWNIKPITIPPFIDNQLFNLNKTKKEKIILSVGRFFPHLHSKNQEKIIKTFQLLKQADRGFAEYKLILAGGLKNEDKKYFDQLKSLTKDDSSIIFKPNVSFDELCQLYKRASYFWHFTGLGIDENKSPEKVEHFGITPLEAMASGCLTFCHNSGGPKKIIKNKEYGFLFNDEKDLIKKMQLTLKNQKLTEKIIKNSQIFVKKYFSYTIFEKKVRKLLL